MINRLATGLAGLALAGLISAPGLAMAQDRDATAELGVILKDLSQEIRALRGEVKELREEMKQARERPVAAAAPPARAARDPNRTYEIALNPSDRVKGDAKAKYALVEFSDFQCPFCNRFHAGAFPEIAENYVDTGKLQYVFRDFPLDFHRKAMPAHIAAHCADKQGEFWGMHHALFVNQKQLGPELYTKTAAEMKLDTQAFSSCMKDPAVAALVEKEKEQGRGYGVRGTPTFFVGEIKDGKVVNARRLAGAQGFDSFARAIDAVMTGKPAPGGAAAVKTAAAPPPAAAPARLSTIKLGPGDRMKGDAGANVVLVEFSDFQCPFCNRFHTQAMPQLQKSYIDSGKLRYVFKDFPLSFHKEAASAHVAAECAGRQNDDAYWAMHHGLFSNQKRLGPQLYEQLATAQSLDLEKFRSCLVDPAVTAAMEKDIEEGRGHGVRGTPTFFVGQMKDGAVVNARRISGAQPFENFARAIDAALGAEQKAAQ